jgi:hypothetical protein
VIDLQDPANLLPLVHAPVTGICETHRRPGEREQYYEAAVLHVIRDPRKRRGDSIGTWLTSKRRPARECDGAGTSAVSVSQAPKLMVMPIVLQANQSGMCRLLIDAVGGRKSGSRERAWQPYGFGRTRRSASLTYDMAAAAFTATIMNSSTLRTSSVR